MRRGEDKEAINERQSGIATSKAGSKQENGGNRAEERAAAVSVCHTHRLSVAAALGFCDGRSANGDAEDGTDDADASWARR